MIKGELGFRVNYQNEAEDDPEEFEINEDSDPYEEMDDESILADLSRRELESLKTIFRQSNHRLLTGEEELELGWNIQAGIEASKELDRLMEPGYPNLKRNKKKLQKAIQEGLKAEAILARHNVRIVIKIAKRFRGQGLDFEELIQEGNVGLLRAIRKFDPTRGHRFSTISVWWIRQQISRAVKQTGNIIRQPNLKQEDLYHFHQKYLLLTQQLGHEPSIRELMTELDIPAEEIEYHLYLLDQQVTISLDKVMSEDADGDEFGESLPGDADTEEAAEVNVTYWMVYNLFQYLSAEERDVLYRNFGLEGTPELFLTEIATKYGVSREAIRLKRNNALVKLRKLLEVKERETKQKNGESSSQAEGGKNIEEGNRLYRKQKKKSMGQRLVGGEFQAKVIDNRPFFSVEYPTIDTPLQYPVLSEEVWQALSPLLHTLYKDDSFMVDVIALRLGILDGKTWSYVLIAEKTKVKYRIIMSFVRKFFKLHAAEYLDENIFREVRDLLSLD